LLSFRLGRCTLLLRQLQESLSLAGVLSLEPLFTVLHADCPLHAFTPSHWAFASVAPAVLTDSVGRSLRHQQEVADGAEPEARDAGRAQGADPAEVVE
jgi:hypothetical protein